MSVILSYCNTDFHIKRIKSQTKGQQRWNDQCLTHLLTVVLQLRKKPAQNTCSLPSPENSFTILITHYHQVFTVFRYRAMNGEGNQFLISNLILKLNVAELL